MAHYISFCTSFSSLNYEQKHSFAKDNRLCFNCLGEHLLRNCRTRKTCRVCNKRHHMLLHPPENIVSNSQHSSKLAAQEQTSNPQKVTSHNVNMVSQRTILLATAQVIVSTTSGRRCTVKALIDPCSEATFVSESIAQRLKLPRQAAFVPVTGVGGAQCNTVKTKATLCLSSHFNDEVNWTINALILPHLTDYMLSPHSCNVDLSFVKGLCLADPHPEQKSKAIEVIIGADFFPLILEEGLRRSEDKSLIAQASKLGWIITGSVTNADNVTSEPVTSHRIQIDQDISQILEKFWLQEEVKTSDLSSLTKDEIECEEHFVNTHKRNSEGRYVLNLPFKNNLSELGNSYPVALSMLHRMKNRFTSTPKFHQEYNKFMSDYSTLNHMRKLSPNSEECRPEKGFTIPQHGIYKTNGDRTKIRVVFNGSIKLNDGLSLKDCLHVGPKLQTDIFDILLRWRTFKYVFSNFVAFGLWKIHLIETYGLATVTYGLPCSPYQAIRVIRQLAADEGAKYPNAAPLLLKNTYVDDILGGADSIETTKQLQKELISLLLAGGFPLSKWSANEPELLSSLAPEKIAPSLSRSWFQSESLQILEVYWEPSTDCFLFQLSEEFSSKNVTKRKALSFVGRLYDPLGWISPIVINFKIFLQSLWYAELSWDQPLSFELKTRWATCLDKLDGLSSFKVPRWCPFNAKVLELHGFSDASERAYAAVVYLKSVDDDGNVTLSLLASKTKVASLKQQTLPRLELSAALLLCLLINRVQTTLSLKDIPCYLWSDSTITLSWIHGHPTQWKTYVANRVAEIQRTMPNAVWKHIPGKENPADLASRGVSFRELHEFELWLQGPEFLERTTASLTQEVPLLSEMDCPDHRSIAVVIAERAPDESELLGRFSSLKSLIRISARFLPFINNIRERVANKSKEKPRRGVIRDLTADELNSSFKFWIKFTQNRFFKKEFTCLSKANSIPHESCLIRLNPFIDPDGLLRVGGRLQHSLLNPDEQHPIILPTQSHLSLLLVRSSHKIVLHGGTQLTLNHLRHRFWILNGRKLVKSTINTCIRCFRQTARPQTQLMENLPTSRVRRDVHPFLHTGVDYAGPIYVKCSKRRNLTPDKGYIAVFVCMTTRAVHLEVASGYSAEDFLNVYRRFTSRRGTPATIRSDCGTTFVGANRELRELFDQSRAESREIAHHLANNGDEWRFNPPAAPHFGGLLEAAVKSTKFHLKTIVGDTHLTFEEMSTVLTQIEACLNSRPLAKLRDDPSDLPVLTPGHFLTGRSLHAIPEPSLLNIPMSRLSRFQLLQRMEEDFWTRWSSEHLHELQQRPKWQAAKRNVKVGDVCLIRSETLPPTKWPLARITAVKPGKDGIIRVVEVRTATSSFLRPISKINVLPLDEND